MAIPSPSLRFFYRYTNTMYLIAMAEAWDFAQENQLLVCFLALLYFYLGLEGMSVASKIAAIPICTDTSFE